MRRRISPIGAGTCDGFVGDRWPAAGNFNATMQHFGKAALRVTKNYTKGYSDTQAKVRAATSNDPWGPSGTQMNEIAQMTYNQLSFLP